EGGSFELDCPQMVLVQDAAAKPVRFEGPGYIRQAEAGSITFKLYPRQADNCPAWGWHPRGAAGKLVEDEGFFTLTAVDVAGREWKSARMIPDVSTFVSEGGSTFVVSGATHWLSHSAPPYIPPERHAVRMRFFDDG